MGGSSEAEDGGLTSYLGSEQRTALLEFWLAIHPVPGIEHLGRGPQPQRSARLSMADREIDLMDPNALTRLKRVAGKQTTTLTHFGRKTGKPHEITIWFVLDGDKLYIGTAKVNHQWVRNVQKTPQVKLLIGGESFSGTARFLSDHAEHERSMAAIRRKYWIFRPLLALGRILTGLGLMHDNSGSFEVTLGP